MSVLTTALHPRAVLNWASEGLVLVQGQWEQGSPYCPDPFPRSEGTNLVMSVKLNGREGLSLRIGAFGCGREGAGCHLLMTANFRECVSCSGDHK